MNIPKKAYGKFLTFLYAFALHLPCAASAQSLTQERLNNYQNPLNPAPKVKTTKHLPAAPPAPGAPAAKPSGSMLSATPPPVYEGQTFSISELEANKFNLAGQVVRVKLTKPVFTPEQISPEAYRVLVMDSASAAYFHFPTEGVTKMRLLQKTERNSMSFFVKVSPHHYVCVGRSRGPGGFTW